jgi:hypothetical protein
MKTHVVLLFLLFTCSLPLTAGNVPIKWGKILPSDIAMKTYPADPEASAVVLCDYGTTTVGPRSECFRHVRIKILKEEGLKYAQVELPYRFYNRYDEVGQIKAHTFNLNEKGELVVSKLKAKSIQDVQVDRKNKKKVFTLPDVKVGSVIEYKYTIFSLDLVKLHDWYFQTTIPVIWSEYRISVSRRFDYMVTFQQGKTLNNDEQKSFAERLQWLYSTKIKKAYRDLMDNNYVLYESPQKTAKVYLIEGQTLRFVMNQMPAIKKNVPAITDLFSTVKVHLYMAAGNFPFYYRPILLTANEDYDTWNRADLRHQWLTGYIVYWLPTWEEANQKWLQNDRIGNRLVKTFGYKPILDQVGLQNGSEKTIQGIYNYVKENVHWDGTYSIAADRDFDDVLKKKSGNSGEMNLMIVALLRRAGIEADPVLIRTNNLGRIENMYPVRDQFNHVIVQVKVNEKTLYLDATGESINDLPSNIQNTNGWLLKSKDFGWITFDKPETPLQVTSVSTKEI